MKVFNFCQKWLCGVSLYLAFFGLFMAVFNQTLIFNMLFNNQVNLVFWKVGELTNSGVLFQRWIYGVLGATCLGWGIILFFIFKHPFKKKEIWAWNCLMAGVVSWYVFDTSISVYFGVILNAMFNSVLMLAILIPLFITRKFFESSKKA